MIRKDRKNHEGSDRPRNPSVEARIRERNRRVITTVLFFLFTAMNVILLRKAEEWEFQETTIPPKAAVIQVKPVEKTREQKILEKIYAKRSLYPEDLLDALKRNPEILDFADKYLDTPPVVSGGIDTAESIQKVPYFIQWDKRWGYVPYGRSNIGISGCGPTCLSMVLYSITRDKSLTPDLLASRAMEEGYYVEGEGTSWLFMEDMGKAYGVKVTQYPYMGLNEIVNELDQGRLIICAMGPGDFTDAGHFIVIKGHANGKLIIYDPFRRANTAKSWDYDRLEPQIQKCWVYGK